MLSLLQHASISATNQFHGPTTTPAPQQRHNRTIPEAWERCRGFWNLRFLDLSRNLLHHGLSISSILDPFLGKFMPRPLALEVLRLDHMCTDDVWTRTRGAPLTTADAEPIWWLALRNLKVCVRGLMWGLVVP